jgi:hypothetical protein
MGLYTLTTRKPWRPVLVLNSTTVSSSCTGRVMFVLGHALSMCRTLRASVSYAVPAEGGGFCRLLGQPCGLFLVGAEGAHTNDHTLCSWWYMQGALI